jgi:hypothetical protein
MTLLSLRTRVQQRVDELATAPTAYTTAQIDAALNEGLRLFALLTLCVERTILVRAQPSQVFYRMLDLISDWLLPLRMRCHVAESLSSLSVWDAPLWDDALFDELFPDSEVTMSPVRPVTLGQLDALNPSWQSAHSPTVLKYGCLGIDQFFIYPSPAGIGTSLEITYAALATRLTAATDVPEIPEAYHQALIHFAVPHLLTDAGGAEFTAAQDDLDKFFDLAKTCGEWVRQRTRTLRYDREPFELRYEKKKAKERRSKQEERAAA